MAMRDLPLRDWMSGRSRAPLVWGGAVLAALVVGIGVWRYIATRPPKPTDDPAKVAKYVASDQFASKDDAEKKAYIEAAMPKPEEFRDPAKRAEMEKVRQTLSPEEQQKLGQTFFLTLILPQIEKRVDAYFNAPEGPQRVAALDKNIDEAETWRKQMEAGRAKAGGADAKPGSADAKPGASAAPGAGRPGGPGGPGGDPAKFMKAIEENIPPASRAKFGEYRLAEQKRRAERGLPPSPWGPR